MKLILYGLAFLLNFMWGGLFLHESGGDNLILRLFSLKYLFASFIIIAVVLLFSSFVISQFVIKKIWLSIPIFFLILAPEMGLRVYYAKESRLILKEDIRIYRQTTFKSFEIIPDSMSLNGIRHSNYGFRGRDISLKKQQNTHRIIFMGGSTTYESCVAGSDKVFTEILEENLSSFFNNKKIEVINAGVPTWASVHSLINFSTYLLDFEPDIIFIMDGLNDAAVRISDNNRSDYAEYYKPMQIPPPKIWESSALFSTILRKYNSPVNKWRPNFWHGLVDVTNAPTISKWIQSQYPHVNEMTEGNMAAHPPHPFERNILSLIGIARQFGVKVVLLTTPILSSSSNKIIEALFDNHQVLKKIAEKENIPIIDLYNLIPQRQELYADIYHLNSKGQPIKAEILFKEIVAQGIIN